LNVPWGVTLDPTGNLYIAENNPLSRRVDEVAKSSGKLSAILTLPATSTIGTSGTPYGILWITDNSSSAGDLLIADPTSNEVYNFQLATSTLTVVAGDLFRSFSGDGGPATSGRLLDNHEVAIDCHGTGNTYIADTDNEVIRKVNTSGIITTLAGTPGVNCAGGTLACGDGGAASSADLNEPSGVAVDSTSGNVYIADTNDNRVRVVTPDGNINKFVGNGVAGYSGDAGLAVNAELTTPFGVATDSAGNVYVADTGNNVVRKVNFTSGIITTIAGNGTRCSSRTAPCGDGSTPTSANLNSPSGVFVDSNGNIYIADSLDNRIRVVNTQATGTITVAGVTIPHGTIATVAGNGNSTTPPTDGISATTSTLSAPRDIAVDGVGNLYIADTQHNLIRRVDAVTGIITTILGSTSAIPGSLNRLITPYGVATCGGNLLVSDTNDKRVIQVPVEPPLSVSCAATKTGQVGVAFNSGPMTVTGGATPYTYSVGSGTLPTGLTLNTSTGAVTGTPTATGTFTIKVTDANGAVGTG
jgi:sugar lactone lactonase YvrE